MCKKRELSNSNFSFSGKYHLVANYLFQVLLVDSKLFFPFYVEITQNEASKNIHILAVHLLVLFLHRHRTQLFVVAVTSNLK